MSVDFNGIGQGQVNTQKPATGKADGSQMKQTGAADTAAARPQPSQGEDVRLSRQAKDLKQLEQQLGDYPDMDDERIEKIRQALADGSYKIDAEKLAQKMLEMDESIFG